MANEIKLKKWNADDDEWVQQYPEVRHTDIVASGTRSASTFLNGNGEWAVPSGSGDGNTKFYAWRAINNTTTSGVVYYKIAHISSQASSRFQIELTGRYAGYGDGDLPNYCKILGQYNNDNNYDVWWFNNETGTSQVVSEVGIVDDGTTNVEVWVKVSNFAEVTATGIISDGTITTYDSNSETSSSPTGYTVTTEYKMWNSGNDGSGSGLDADKLDNVEATSFLRSDATDTATGALTLSNSNNHYKGHHYFDAYDANGNHYPHYLNGSNNNGAQVNMRVYNSSGQPSVLFIDGNSDNMTWRGHKIWNAGNDGSGSGLDADKLDNLEASAFWQKSGTWLGDLASNGYTRVQGVNSSGGDFALGVKSGQMSTLIDGQYLAYESNNGFYGSYNSSYGNLTGFKATDADTITITQLDGGDANLIVTGDLTVNGTTTTLDTTVSTTDQWTVTNAGTDIATIINQTGTADILDVRDNGTSVFKIKDGGNVEMKTDTKLTIGASTTANEAKIILDSSNGGHPQISLAENNDASWGIGVDDGDNSFKIHGASSSTIPTIAGLATPHFELDTTGNMWLQKRLYLTSNAFIEYNSTNDSIDFFFN